MEKKISVALSRNEDGSCEKVVVLAQVNKQELAKLINESTLLERQKQAKIDEILKENEELKAKLEQLEKDIAYLKGE